MVQKQPETPSEIIKAERDKSDLTVEELTDRVGITERYLYAGVQGRAWHDA